MASTGNSHPEVTRRVMVGIIATGDEIVEPDVKPEVYQIRNSNSYQLMTQVERTGVNFRYYGIASDTKEAISELVGRAAGECDVILISGGISMGEFDFTQDVLNDMEFDTLFNKVAVKPGKPTTFAVSGATYCFGLPGNPVSTFVIYEILVKPFIYKIMGHDYTPVSIKLPLMQSITRTKTEREEWVPVTINEDGEVIPLSYHGSGHFNSLAGADGLVCFPRGVARIERGRVVYVRQI